MVTPLPRNPKPSARLPLHMAASTSENKSPDRKKPAQASSITTRSTGAAMPSTCLEASRRSLAAGM